MKWISELDRLPIEGLHVLVCTESKEIWVGYLEFSDVEEDGSIGHTEWDINGEGREDVTHWMPLPEAPE